MDAVSKGSVGSAFEGLEEKWCGKIVKKWGGPSIVVQKVAETKTCKDIHHNHTADPPRYGGRGNSLEDHGGGESIGNARTSGKNDGSILQRLGRSRRRRNQRGEVRKVRR